MWGSQLRERYSDVIEFVGLCDINPKRVEASKALMGVQCPTYTNFDEMLDKARPDVVMVTTRDSFHSEYIVSALDRGFDVMTEKPMVIDEKQCQAVLDAEKRNNKRSSSPSTTAMRRRTQGQRDPDVGRDRQSVVGRLRLDLDVKHGADYFRRWHAYKNSGGSLWVHKATHHFDLVNWWLAADPVEVVANGQLQVYGKNGKIRGENCRLCPHKTECRFYYDMTRTRRG